MNLRKQRSGFTLLEIIVVIIIVGVLASLALPRFFSTIEYSRSTEALNALGTIKRAAERCSMQAGAAGDDFTLCQNFTQLDMEDPSSVDWIYTLNSGAPGDLTITASRTGANGGDGAAVITLTGVGGAWTRAGTNAFSSIK